MDDSQLLYYSRHILLPQIDYDGQQKLLDAKVMIVGLGGLGCASATYLAGSGVGQLSLVDPDEIELSNLPRQVLYSREDVGEKKACVAAQKLQKLNTDVRFSVHVESLLANPFWQEQLSQVDLVIDASDSMACRGAINRLCLTTKTPWVFASASGFYGQMAVFNPQKKGQACYRCLYPQQTELVANCVANGVIAPLVGIIGNSQALEGIKLLCGLGEPSLGKLFVFDGLLQNWQTFTQRKNPNCTVCVR